MPARGVVLGGQLSPQEALVSVPQLGIKPDKCPKCGACLIYGYGLMGGGVGPYVLCDGDACDYFEKQPEDPSGDES